MQGSIILLAIVCMIQTITIHFMQKDIHFLKRQIITLYAVIYNKFNLTVEEAIEITEDYAKERKNFMDREGA